MELTNEFGVGVPVDEAWAVLTDVERIAPCMPGAQLQEVEGDEYRGIVKVKVGPITAQYKGTATFVEHDDAAHARRAQGRGPRHPGPGQRLGDHHRQLARRRRRHRGRRRHRPGGHRQGRAVRPRRAGRRERQAARPVRRGLETDVLAGAARARGAGGRPTRPGAPAPEPADSAL